MTDLTIRPTAKFIMLRAILAVLVFLALEIAWYTQWRDREDLVRYLPIIAPLLLIWPLPGAMRRQFSKTTISGDRLRYEIGGFSKSTRTLQLSKLQDVRVDQTLTQRMFGVGNVSLETSGETSRLTLEDIDNPQAVADDLLNRSHGVSASA